MNPLFINQAPHFVDAPIIVKDYHVLHYDEMPVLYVGRNRYNDIVIGSFVEETADGSVYFHTITSESDLRRFVLQECSYRDILFEATFVWTIAVNHGESSARYYQVPPRDIPDEYLPTEESMCPEVRLNEFCGYSVAIQKKEPEDTSALVKEVVRIMKMFEKQVESILSIFKSENGYKAATRVIPSTAGSHRVNFRIDWTGQGEMFVDPRKYDEYLTKALGYITRNFIDDYAEIANDEMSKDQAELFQMANRIVAPNLNSVLTESAFRESIYSTAAALSEMTEIISDEVKSVVLSGTSNGFPMPIARLDGAFRDKLENAVATYVSTITETKTDTSYRTYRIYVFSLNADTGKGRALYEKDDRVQKIRFSVNTKESVNRSKLSDSLDAGQYCEVMAKGTYIGTKLVDLKISYESINRDGSGGLGF